MTWIFWGLSCFFLDFLCWVSLKIHTRPAGPAGNLNAIFFFVIACFAVVYFIHHTDAPFHVQGRGISQACYLFDFFLFLMYGNNNNNQLFPNGMVLKVNGSHHMSDSMKVLGNKLYLSDKQDKYNKYLPYIPRVCHSCHCCLYI